MYFNSEKDFNYLFFPAKPHPGFVYNQFQDCINNWRENNMGVSVFVLYLIPQNAKRIKNKTQKGFFPSLLDPKQKEWFKINNLNSFAFTDLGEFQEIGYFKIKPYMGLSDHNDISASFYLSSDCSHKIKRMDELSKIKFAEEVDKILSIMQNNFCCSWNKEDVLNEFQLDLKSNIHEPHLQL